MNLHYALLLGILQGLTEFIPVSSTAHLLIAQQFLGIKASEEVFAFLVIVQLGTLLSLIIYYWRDLRSLAISALQLRAFRTSAETRLGWYILLATLPALISGYLLQDAVETLFHAPLPEAAVRLFSAALLLTMAERLSKKSRALDSMTWWDAVVIGLFQVIAVFPGASRSGTTISGGMLRGFDRASAARFAFLLSIPIMLAAGGYELLQIVESPHLKDILPALVVGCTAAACSGWWAIRWLLAFLRRHSLYGFAAYCAGLGVLVTTIWLLTRG
jgi:undecaprenyl-diphosphatase